MNEEPAFPTRRRHQRVRMPEGVLVLWRWGRTEDTSPVKDLSVGGLFVETKKVCPVDAAVKLNFPVEDGEITAEACVRHVKAGSGLGLQFKSARSGDRARFATMIMKLINNALADQRRANLPHDGVESPLLHLKS